MLGERYVKLIGNPNRDLFGSFNSCLGECSLLVFIDEMDPSIGKKYDSIIKEMITSREITINKKNENQINRNNYIRFIFFNNKDLPLKVDLSDRRFFVSNCTGEKRNNKYYANLLRIINDKRVLKAYFEYLKTINIQDFDWCNSRPKSEFLEDLKTCSLPKEMMFMIDYIQEKLLQLKDHNLTINIQAKTLFGNFIDYIRQNDPQFITNDKKFGILIKNYKIDGLEKTRNTHGYVYILHLEKIKQWMIKRGFLQECDFVNKDQTTTVNKEE